MHLGHLPCWGKFANFTTHINRMYQIIIVFYRMCDSDQRRWWCLNTGHLYREKLANRRYSCAENPNSINFNFTFFSPFTQHNRLWKTLFLFTISAADSLHPWKKKHTIEWWKKRSNIWQPISLWQPKNQLESTFSLFVFGCSLLRLRMNAFNKINLSRWQNFHLICRK